MKLLPISIAIYTMASAAVAQTSRDINERQISNAGSTAVVGEIWVDNWFELSINGTKLIEDSTAYHTERSFNAERVQFNADFPMTIAFEFRDFMENDTGLEYIGSRRQQIGDGGATAQFFDASTGAFLVGTSEEWRCTVAQHAPVSESCADEASPQVGLGACASQTEAIPANWTAPEFDDSSWAQAVEHSEREVGPKFGYDEISWNREASLIWAQDLKLDNIVMCRITIDH